MRIVPIVNRISIFCFVLFFLCCTSQNVVPNKNILNKFRKIDSMIVVKQPKNAIFLNLYEDTTNDSSRYLYLAYFSTRFDGLKLFKIPYSSLGYGYGTGFSDSFDTYGIISMKLKKLNGDFNVVQYGDKQSLFYSFTMNNKNSIISNYIYIIFRHSNNYGVEPEIIELTQYKVGIALDSIRFHDFKYLEEKIAKNAPDSTWNYQILPNSNDIVPILK